MERYLVTGGAGFIGSNITESLLKDGAFVRVLDNFITGKRENIDGFKEMYSSGFELVEGDLRDSKIVARASEGVDYILHQGALPSVPRSVEDPVLTNEINVGGTLNVLIAARDSGVKRVVFASSSSIYGDTPELPKREDMPPSPKSPYALQKLAAEFYCRLFYELYGLQTISLRYFNVFGPRQDPGSMYAAVIPKFVTAMLNGERPVVFGDGKQTRDFTYIDNVVRANRQACHAPADSCGKAINVACRKKYSLIDLLENLESITGISPNPVFEPPAPGDVRDSMADISLAERYLSFEVSVGFKEGLERTVRWYEKVLKKAF